MKDFANTIIQVSAAALLCAGSAAAQNSQVREVLTVTDGEVVRFDGQRALASAASGTRILLASLDGRERVIYDDPNRPIERAELYQNGALLRLGSVDPPAADAALWDGSLRTLDLDPDLGWGNFEVEGRWLAYTGREPGSFKDELILRDLVAGTEVWRRSDAGADDRFEVTFDLTKDGDLLWQETTSTGSRGYFRRGGTVTQLWATPDWYFSSTDGINVVIQESSPPFTIFLTSPAGAKWETLAMGSGPTAIAGGWVAYTAFEENIGVRAYRRAPSGQRELLPSISDRMYLGQVSPAGDVVIQGANGDQYLIWRDRQVQQQSGQLVYSNGWYSPRGKSVYAIEPPRPIDACGGAFSRARGDIPHTNNGPSFDGVRDPAWLGARPYSVRDLIRGAVADAADLSGSWRALWDESYLYLFAEVRDERLRADSSQAWEDDSLEVYLDGDLSRGATYDGRNDYQYIFRPGGTRVEFGVNSRRDASGVRFATRLRTEGDGYDMEIAVPWSILGGPPSPGRSLGIDVHLNDDDGGGSRAGKLATFAKSDDAWTRPSSFGVLSLGDYVNTVDVIARTPPGADIAPGAFSWRQTPTRANWKVLSGASNNRAVASLWWVFWDEQALHVYVAAQDDVRFRDSSEPWQDDSIEIYLDADASHGTEYDGRNDYQYIFRLDDPVVHVGARSLPNTAGIRFTFGRFDAAGHTLVASIPWSTLGVTPCEGGLLGIDVQINDDDDGGLRDGKVASFAALDDAWRNPSSFGLLELGGYASGYYY